MDNEQLPKGYKNTEVGVIPEDWSVDKLDSLSSRIGDGIHTTPKYSSDGDYYFVNGNNLNNGEILISDDTKRVSKDEFLLHSRDLDSRTLLLSINGTIGNIAFYNNENIILGKSAAYIKLNNKIDKNLIYQLLQTEFIKRYFENELTGSTIKNLGLGSIRNTPIPIPPTIEEQTAIATALSDADALINSLSTLIAKKRNIKQGAMQKLFSIDNCQLTIDNGGWEVKKLGNIGKPYGGLSGKSKLDFADGKFPYIPFMNIMSNPIIDTSYVDYVNIGVDENQNKALKGDLFFNGSSETPEEVGMCSVLLEDIPNLYLNSFCFGFRLNKDSKENGLYLSYYFRSSEGRKLFYSMAQGATRYNLSKSNFNKMEVSLPQPEQQNEIATILSDMDAEIQALVTKLEKYRKIKLGMMQNLLTGKIRLV